MSETNVEYQRLMAEFEEIAGALDAVLKDLEWRKPDVEEEKVKLEQLREQAKTDLDLDVGTQAVVVRVLCGVLDDKIAEANRLEARMVELKAALEKAAGPEPAAAEGGESGQTIH